jgi:hypothetical protein
VTARGERRSLAAVVVLAACVSAGCARPGPPGGGPLDTTPPAVVRTAPADGAASVQPETPIEIEFSEEMSRDSVERAFSIAPSRELGGLQWRGTTLTATALTALPDSTTFVVTIGASAQDYHSVALGAPHSFAFSTGPVVDSCIVSGSVGASGAPVQGATVWLVRDAARPDSAGVFAQSGRGTTTGQDGAFRFTHVAASFVAYSIVAFLDADRDARFDPGKETGTVLDAVARVAAPGDSAGGIDIVLTPPRAGGGAEE